MFNAIKNLLGRPVTRQIEQQLPDNPIDWGNNCNTFTINGTTIRTRGGEAVNIGSNGMHLTVNGIEVEGVDGGGHTIPDEKRSG